MTTKTVKAPVRIPKAPKRLFRTIWSIVSKQPDRFYMGDWHRSNSVGYSMHAESLLNMHAEKVGPRSKEMKTCSTVHCMAGWITYATRGGLELERFLHDMDSRDMPLNEWWNTSVSDYAKSISLPTGQAALLILEKSGWAPYVKGKDFLMSDKPGLKKLKQLMELETEYDGPPPAKPAKRTARA